MSAGFREPVPVTRSGARRGVHRRQTRYPQQCDSALRVRAGHTQSADRSGSRLSAALAPETGRGTESVAIAGALRCGDQRNPDLRAKRRPGAVSGVRGPNLQRHHGRLHGTHRTAIPLPCARRSLSGGRPAEWCPSPILAFAADGFPVFGPFGCIDAECSRVVEFKSSWNRVSSPRHDAWDAYRFVPELGTEYLDRCNGHSGDDQNGKYPLSRHPHLALHHWLFLRHSCIGRVSPGGSPDRSPRPRRSRSGARAASQ